MLYSISMSKFHKAFVGLLAQTILALDSKHYHYQEFQVDGAGDNFLDRHQSQAKTKEQFAAVRRPLRRQPRTLNEPEPSEAVRESPKKSVELGLVEEGVSVKQLDRDGMTTQTLSQKAKGDAREYQMVKLSNGVQVLAIQDKTAQQAAFSVAVTAGQFYDPPEFLGLAHLCEHAVFLGTEKYPERTGFDEFLAKHGGQTNAYTASEATVYYASLDEKAFEEGIDRFADFFRAPLFNISTVWDEIRAVESEHSKNKNNMQWRTERAMLSLANPLNPIEWFHTGDDESLEGLGEKPLEQALKKYFNEHYCPHRLNLVTFGKDSTSQQLATAAKSFGAIKRRPECKAGPVSFAQEAPFNKAERLGNLLHVDGANPIPQLWLMVPMESITPLHKSRPLKYIRRLLSYEGEDSLLFALNTELQLAKSLSVSSDDTSAGTMIWLRFDLTDQGLKTPMAVLDTLFAYLAKLHKSGLTHVQLESLKLDSKLDWDWRESVDAETATQDFAELMTRYTPSELLQGDEVITEPNVEAVQKVLEQIIPENMNVGLAELSPQWPNGKEVKTLPHYGSQYVRYSLDELASDNLLLWKRWFQKNTSDVEIDATLLANLQKVNSNLSELPKMQVPEEMHVTQGTMPLDHAQAKRGASEVAQVLGEVPRQLVGRDFSSQEQLFFREGWMVPGPRVQARFFLRPAEDSKYKDQETPLSRVLNLIGIDILGKVLNGRLAKYVNSGTTYSLAVTPGGINLGVLAFKPDIEAFSKQVLLEVKKELSAPQIMFDRAWGDLYQKLNICEGPLIAASKVFDLLLRTDEFNENELLDVLDGSKNEVTKEAVEKYMADQWKGHFSSTGLIYGAISDQEALKLSKNVLAELNTIGAQVDVAGDEVERVSPVVNIDTPIEFRSMNPCAHNSNHVYRMRVLLGVPSIRQTVLLSIIKPVIQELSFSELRTKSGLGYIVGSDVTQMSNVLTVECFIQGEVMPPDDLELQCERVWAKSVPERFENMSANEFESLKASYRAQLLSPPNGHEEEVGLFAEALLQGQCTNLQTELLNFLDTVESKDDVLNEWRRAVLPDISTDDMRKKVTVKYFGHGSSPSLESVPPTTRSVQVKARKLGLDEVTVARLVAEIQNVRLVNHASSHSRKRLEIANGFFDTELKCSVDTSDNNNDNVLAGMKERVMSRKRAKSPLFRSSSLLELGEGPEMQERGPFPEDAPGDVAAIFSDAQRKNKLHNSFLRPSRPRALAAAERIAFQMLRDESKK
jgi:secreted Zn-dependent insulinase-like peptidase